MARATKGKSQMTTLAELRQANLKEQKMSDTADIKAGEIAVALNAPVPEPAAAPAPLQQVQQQPVAQPNTNSVFLEKVRESLSSRTMHPIGSKVTTDMSPALFNRAKRFCAAHGNITLRQLFLDLLTNFLEEEGY
jgi:hypothetical protein